LKEYDGDDKCGKFESRTTTSDIHERKFDGRVRTPHDVEGRTRGARAPRSAPTASRKPQVVEPIEHY